MDKLMITILVFCSSGGCIFCSQDPEWWKKTIVYQIYPRSFQDSNGDGVGDLNGITSRLDYIKSLGVDTIWLSPVYVSPMADFGYDIADHKDIDPIFGTIEDFKRLITAAHDRDMYIVMDFVPNHSSDKHPWFKASRKSQEPYTNFYTWHEGKLKDDGSRSPPNNWLSIFSGSAWEWDEERQQFYLHQFLKEQPDLNYREPAVRQAMEEVLKFWLETGVDGFRVDAINTLFEVEDLSKDEPRSNDPRFTMAEHGSLDHPYTLHLDEIHDVIREWRQVLDRHEESSGKHPFMVMEVYSENMDDITKYYYSGADIPFNFGFIPVNDSCGGVCFKEIVQQWIEVMPEGKWPNFVLSNHDQRRITTRKGPEYVKALNTMLLLLPGTPTTYMGEEIGQRDIPTPSKEKTQDPWGARLGEEYIEKYSRDPCRAPIQWNSDKNAGFSTADETWLPVHPGYATHNVQSQEGDPGSPLTLYREAALLRKQQAFQNSQIQFGVINDNIFSFTRGQLSDDTNLFLVILNLGKEESTDDYSDVFGTGQPVPSGELVLSSVGEKGETMRLNGIHMRPGDVHVIKITPRDQHVNIEL